MNEMQEKTISGADAAPGGPASVASSATSATPVIAAAAAKRANASVIGMIIALVVSIAAFLPIVLMNPSPKSEGFRPNVNVSAVSRNAADVAGFTPAVPAVGEAFRSNYARWESGTTSGVATWEIGYLTPKDSFIGLVQTQQSNPTWLLQQVHNAPVTGTHAAGGQDWQLRDTGNGEKSLVLDYRGSTVILTGSAQLEEFSVLAAAVVQSMDTASAATDPAVTVSQPAGDAP